jgi:hypothetical protein
MRNLPYVLVMLGMTSFFGASMGLHSWYRDNRPPEPDPASGRTYIHHVRGPGDVYVTRAEQWTFEGLMYGGLLVAMVGGIIFDRRRRKGAA